MMVMELLVELQQHGVAAGDTAGLGQGGLAGVLDETAAVVLFEIMPIAAGDGEAPVAKSPAVRIAIPAGPEDGRGGVLAGQRLGVAEGLERLVDGRVDGLSGAGRATSRARPTAEPMRSSVTATAVPCWTSWRAWSSATSMRSPAARPRNDFFNSTNMMISRGGPRMGCERRACPVRLRAVPPDGSTSACSGDP